MAKKKDTASVPTGPGFNFKRDAGYNLEGAVHQKSETGKGDWKSISVTPYPDEPSSNMGDKSDSNKGMDTSIHIVEPVMPSIDKRPGSGKGGKHPNHTPVPTPNPAWDDSAHSVPNAWKGPDSTTSTDSDRT